MAALADLDSLLAYVADTSPRGARRVQKRLQHVIDLLLVQPKMGVPTHDPSIRRLTALPYPFLIFYEVADDEIIIHAARNPAHMPGSEEPT